MVPTNFKRMHPKPGVAGRDAPDDNAFHAVGISMEKLAAKGDDET